VWPRSICTTATTISTNIHFPTHGSVAILLQADIRRFIRHPQQLELWTPRYFYDLAAKLKIKP
jgi:hypothetical protein